jgi:RhoGEF domain
VETALSVPHRGIKNIVNELLSNEAIYVENLYQGIQNYAQPMEDPELSPEIREAKLEIFGNIREIYNFHATSFYPALQSCNLNVTKIADTFLEFVKYGDFYCYVLFMLGRERALLLCKKYKTFFDELRTRCQDRLDVSSFLLQPVQRLPRYQLLLTELIKELSKHRAAVNMRPLLRTVCMADKMVERFLVMSNEAMSINEIVQKNLVRKFRSKSWAFYSFLCYSFSSLSTC